MSLEPIHYFFCFGDYFVSTALVILFFRFWKNNILPKYLIKAFMIGCVIGSTWEFTFHFLGDEFAYAVKQWPLGLSGWPKKLSHSIWDGGLFMFGIWLCFKYLPLPLFTRFSWRELGIMEAWGIFQELLVEYLFNGRVWVYNELPWNPVIIPPLPGSATTVGYTLIPQAVWVVAPVVFYLILLRLPKEQ